MVKTYVLDTSVVLKWFNQENEKNIFQALQILEDFKEQKIKLIFPDLLLVETANAFLKGKNLPIKEVKNIVKNLFALPVIIKEPTPSTIMRAVEMVEKKGITVYDALFAATAQIENCLLISDDKKGHGEFNKNVVMMLRSYPVENN